MRLLPASLVTCLLIQSPLAQSEKPEGSIPEAKRFETKGEVVLADGTRLGYTAIASETHIKDADGDPTSSIFSVAYLAHGVEEPSQRPITFVFNGGPGSSSIWLHLGLLGPQRIAVPSDATDAGAAPYRLESNPLTLLAVSDLVFIDPVGTGYSRSLGESEDESFWGLDEDATSVAEFIRLVITKNKRWNSPKYICGESYGSIRAAMLVRELQGNYNGIALNGVMLIGSAMDLKFLFPQPGNEIAYVTFLPSYAATAWYHDVLPERPAELEPFLREVRDFASSEYLTALFKGDRLSEDETAALVDKLHRYTGLSEDYLRRCKLRINSSRFLKELLRDEGKVLGRYDSRYAGRGLDDVAEFPSYDPSGSGVDGAFTSAINDYLGRVLGVDFEREYEILSLGANASWQRPASHRRFFSGYVNVTPLLAEGAAQNEDLRFFVASGYYALPTTFFATEYMISHSDIDRDRVTLRNYPAGHMTYVHEPSYQALAEDLRAFVGAGQKERE